MSGIFISYRRADSDGWTGRLRDTLRARFGKRVFHDVDNIPDGEIFSDVIDRALKSCEVALIIIGPNWANARDERGRRLDQDEDWVRTEAAMVLERKIRVIPVLVGGATLPRADELPEALRSITRRQAREIRSTSWDSDVGMLIDQLQQILGQSRKPVWMFALPAAAVAAAIAGIALYRGADAPDPAAPPVSPVAAAPAPQQQPPAASAPAAAQPAAVASAGERTAPPIAPPDAPTAKPAPPAAAPMPADRTSVAPPPPIQPPPARPAAQPAMSAAAPERSAPGATRPPPARGAEFSTGPAQPPQQKAPSAAPERLAAAPVAPGAPAAPAGATVPRPAPEKSAGAGVLSFPNRPASARELKVGDTWTYRLRDMRFSRNLATVTHEISGGDARSITEAVRAGAGADGESPSAATRRLGLEPRIYEQQVDRDTRLFEFAPFMAGYSELQPGLAWSKIAGAGSPDADWRFRGKVTGRERVSVPAGSFEAIKADLEGDLDVSFPTTRDMAAETNPSYQTYTVWFVPEIGRAVKSVRRTYNRARVLLDHEQYELVAYKHR